MTLRDVFDAVFPALLAVVLILLSGAPMMVWDVPLAPPMAWLATLAMGMLAPQRLGLTFAIALGILQDSVFGLPLGCFGLLNGLLCWGLQARPQRASAPSLKVVAMESALVIWMLHLLLWLVLLWIGQPPRVTMVVGSALASTLWFMPVYAVFRKLMARRLG